MNTNTHAWLRTALFALLVAPLAALAAVQEIPITTSSAEARLAFDAGQAALDRGDAPQANELFRTAVAADPNFTYAWVNLSNVTFSTEEFIAALKGARAGRGEGERRRAHAARVQQAVPRPTTSMRSSRSRSS